MGICVELTSSGTLTPTGEPTTTCSAYVLISGSEYSLVGAIDSAFGMPDAEQAREWFVAPFCLVVFLYLFSRCCGSIVNMFSDKGG